MNSSWRVQMSPEGCSGGCLSLGAPARALLELFLSATMETSAFLSAVWFENEAEEEQRSSPLGSLLPWDQPACSRVPARTKTRERGQKGCGLREVLTAVLGVAKGRW